MSNKPMAQNRLLKLSDPFDENEIEWRVQRSGIKNSRPWAVIVPYLNARSIQKRLDETVGQANWKNVNTPIENGMLCTISIKINGDWVSKTDGAQGDSHIDGMDSIKSSCSRAMVRAAVLWGIGRYLYEFPITFATFVSSQEGANYLNIDGKEFFWVPYAQKPSHAEPKAQELVESRISEIPKVVRHPKKSLGDEVIPFGSQKGRILKELATDEIYELVSFYNRFPNPKGEAKSFKPLLYLYVEELVKKQKS